MDGLDDIAGQVPGGLLVDGASAEDGRSGFVRDRAHRFPSRRNALKVLYDDVEVASVRAAAQLAGLTVERRQDPAGPGQGLRDRPGAARWQRPALTVGQHRAQSLRAIRSGRRPGDGRRRRR